MTLVINQFLDQQSSDDESHAKYPSGVVDEAPLESSMHFWDQYSESDDEHIEEILAIDMQVVKDDAPKVYNLRNKGPVSNDPSLE